MSGEEVDPPPLRLQRRKKVDHWEMGAGRELGVSASLTASNWPEVIACQ